MKVFVCVCIYIYINQMLHSIVAFNSVVCVLGMTNCYQGLIVKVQLISNGANLLLSSVNMYAV